MLFFGKRSKKTISLLTITPIWCLVGDFVCLGTYRQTLAPACATKGCVCWIKHRLKTLPSPQEKLWFYDSKKKNPALQVKGVFGTNIFFSAPGLTDSEKHPVLWTSVKLCKSAFSQKLPLQPTPLRSLTSSVSFQQSVIAWMGRYLKHGAQRAFLIGSFSK